MDNPISEQTKNEIPTGYYGLKELANRYGYSPDHIGWLARTGKVSAIQIGPKGEWFVREQSLLQYRQSFEAAGDYRPLFELADRYGYAKDYLGSLARSGRISAIKSSNGQWYARESSVRSYYDLSQEKKFAPALPSAEAAPTPSSVSVPVPSSPVLSEVVLSHNEGSYSANPKRRSKRPHTAAAYLAMLGGILILIIFSPKILNTLPENLATNQASIFSAIGDFWNSLFPTTSSSPKVVFAPPSERLEDRQLAAANNLPSPSPEVVQHILKQVVINGVTQSDLDKIKTELASMEQVSVNNLQTSLADLSTQVSILQAGTARVFQAPLPANLAIEQYPNAVSFSKADFSGPVTVADDLTAGGNFSSNGFVVKNGSVGIGITNPSAALEISGTASISDDLNVGHSLSVG